MENFKKKSKKGIKVLIATRVSGEQETIEEQVAAEFVAVATKTEVKGFKKITEKALKRQEEEAKRSVEFPTIPSLVAKNVRKLAPDYCTNGDMDRCPAPCGACLYVNNPASVVGIELEYIPILDTRVYLNQNPQAATQN